MNTSAETVQAVNKWTLEVLVHGLVCLHYVGLCWACLRKALSGRKLCRTIGEGVFLLATVAIYRNK